MAIQMSGSICLAETAPSLSELPSKSYQAPQDYNRAERCRAFAEANPELKDLLHLDAQPPPAVGPVGYARACLKGGYDSFKDAIVDTVSLPYVLWNPKSVELTEKLTLECQKSEKCLELLFVEANGRLPSAEQLEGLKKADFGELDVLHRNARMRMNSTGMQNKIFREQLENKKWANWKSSTSQYETLPPNEDTSWFWASIRQTMDNYAEKWYCLKPEVAVEFYCYNLTLLLQSVGGGVAVVKSPRVARLLKAKIPLWRYPTIDKLAGRRFSYLSAIPERSAPRMTNDLFDHVRARHIHNKSEMIEVLREDASESALVNMINRKFPTDNVNQTIETTIYPQNVYDKVLANAYSYSKASPGRVERLPGSKYRTERIDLEVDIDDHRYEIQLRVCRESECLRGQNVLAEGDITQLFIKCGAGGAVLPPLRCVWFKKDKGASLVGGRIRIGNPEASIEVCGKYFEGGIGREVGTGRPLARGRFKALNSPPCD